MKLVKCKICGVEYERQRIGQKTCSVKCAIEMAKAQRIKVEKKEDRAKRIKLKTMADWMKEAQAAFNKYVRIRDHGKPCISCGSMPEQKYGGMMDCSHYRSTGAAKHLRFHLHNAAAACVKCNRYLSGNVVELRKGLIERIGTEKVEAIDNNNTTAKFDIEYLSRIKAIFTRKANRLIKRNGLHN